MKTSRALNLSAFALCALAGAAYANPVSWFTIAGPVNSRGLQGDANNAVLTSPAIPADGPWTYLTISGNLTKVGAANTFAAEACIEVTTPSGARFIVKPFESGAFSGTIPVPLDAAVIPSPGSLNTPGACSLRFFELYADNAASADATWSNLQFTLHNSAGGDLPPAELTSTLPLTAQNPDESSANLAMFHNSWSDTMLEFNTARIVDKVRLKGYGTANRGWSANSARSPLSYATITLTAQRADGGGIVSWSVDPFGDFAASSSGFDITVDTPVPVLTGPGNDWSYRISSLNMPTLGGSSGNFAGVWTNVQPLAPDAPTADDLGTIRSRPALGPEVSTAVKTQTVSLTPAAIKWFTFTTEHPCSDASGYWLDIHSQLVAGSPVIDHEFGLYTTGGVRLANDDDGGSGLLSQLSFGQTSPVRAPVDPNGGPYPRNGHNGVLPAATHYLSVSEINTTFFDSGWYMTSNSTHTGDLKVEFRTNLPPLIPAFTDLGVIRQGQPVVQATVPAGQIKWYRFDLERDVNSVTHFYLDIDTIGASTPAFTDTEIALYDGHGVKLAQDDDDGNNSNRSQLSFGVGLGNRVPINGSAPGDGRDGNLVAGRYYLATGLFDATFADEWAASTNANSAATYPINFRTNLVTSCGPADVGSTGGVAVADGMLDNNDFIAFISYFFANSPAADLGSTGGIAGADGQWNNNDFIVFISFFFAGCP